jgi:hypothetical protein
MDVRSTSVHTTGATSIAIAEQKRMNITGLVVVTIVAMRVTIDRSVVRITMDSLITPMSTIIVMTEALAATEEQLTSNIGAWTNPKNFGRLLILVEMTEARNRLADQTFHVSHNKLKSMMMVQMMIPSTITACLLAI